MATARAVRTYLEPELAKAVAHAACVEGRSESAIIADAVRTRLSAEESRSDQLHRLELRLDKLMRDNAILRESMLVLIRVWLARGPALAEAVQGAADAGAQARFEWLLSPGAAHLSPGNAPIDLDLPRSEQVSAACTLAP